MSSSTTLRHGYVPSEVHSVDQKRSAMFDASYWLASNTDDEILAVAQCDWHNDQLVTNVAQYMCRFSPTVRDVFAYLEQWPAGSALAKAECVIDKDQALQWLRENRPALLGRILRETQ